MGKKSWKEERAGGDRKQVSTVEGRSYLYNRKKKSWELRVSTDPELPCRIRC